MTALVAAADLFCGAGGTSSGLADACADLGLPLQLVAINHWQIAIETHSANHPDVEHYCSDLEDLDPRQVVPGGRLRLLVASPECTHFSNARGGEPVTNQNRASVKYVLRWLSALDVEDVLIENVPEFRHWGPLHRQGAQAGRPIKARKGEYFRRFIRKMEALGYRVEWRILCAADYGDATSRRRLFIRARQGGRPVTWPTPTHGPAGKTDTLFGQLRPYRTARDILDLRRKGRSIFNRDKPLSENTMRRIMAGLRKFSGLPFVLPNEGVNRGNAPRPVDAPLNTVTSRGAGAVVQPFLVAIGQTGGNGDRTRSVNEPVPTIVSKAELAVVEPFIIGAGGPQGAGQPASVDEPLKSVLGTNHHAVVQPFLVKYYEGSDAAPVDAPLPTVTANYEHLGLAQPYLIKLYGNGEGAASADAPIPTITGGGEHIALAQPFLVEFHGGQGNESRAKAVDGPLPTQTTEPRFGLASPDLRGFIVQMEHSSAKSGDARRVYDTERPLPTITSKAHFGLVELEPFIVKYYGNGEGAAPVDAPLPTVTATERFGLAVPVRDGWAVIDILFRMLDPDELARAHSMDEYEFRGTKRDIVKQIGNSVPRRLARALCRAALEA